MNLAIRDHKIFQLKAELENRKKILCMKRKQLKTNVNENSFLKDVMNDYEKYNTHLIGQKEKQIVFFQKLTQYIENITNDLQLTDSKLKETKSEQRDILKEISYLKNELSDLVIGNSSSSDNENGIGL